MKWIKVLCLVIIGFLIMALGQAVASIWDVFIPYYGIGALLFGITYIFVSLWMIRLIIKKVFKADLVDYRITRFKLNKIAFLIALVLPIGIYALYILFVPGEWITHLNGSNSELLNQLSWSIFVNAMGAAVVEECICRGLLMGYIEKQWNIQIAIMMTSVFFAAIHLLNGVSDFYDVFLLLMSGSLVGIMFGLLVYVFKTIWASIIVHFFWNLFQVIQFSTNPHEAAPLIYLMKLQARWITGSDYGIETSVISILGYLMVIMILMFYYFKQREQRIH